MNFAKIITLTVAALLFLTSCITINYPHTGIGELLTAPQEDSSNEVTESESNTTENEESSADIESNGDTETIDTEPPTVGEVSESTISLKSITSPISSNNTATLTIVGKPNTEYNIKVIYTTTESKAKGLENKISDENGIASWSWKIGASVKSGYYKITVSDGTEVFETKIQVE